MATATTQTTSNVDSLNISAKQISQSTYRVSDSDNSTKSSNLVERSFERSRYNDGIDRFLSTFILDEVIADAVLAISKFAIPREVQVAFEPTDEAIVCADRDMIFAMVHNLISNAVKFSHRNEMVMISSKIERDRVKVSISNSGIGISKEKLHQLFLVDSKSVRLDAIDETIAGIELLLCHRFAEKNRGELVVTSGDAQGKMFAFSLPKSA